MKAMVLAAGVGSRLDPLTAEIPKPLVPVANVPVMQHLLQLLHRHNFRQVIANLHYLPQKLVEYFGDGSAFGVDLEFRLEEKLSGDAGGVRYCRDFLGDDTFIVLMGDLLTDIDLSYVLAQHKAKGALASIALKQVEDVSHFGVAVLDENQMIKGFQEKPSKEEALSNLASTGVYVLEPAIFDHIPATGDYGFGRQLFPKLVAAGLPVAGIEIVGSYWSDVGTIAQYCRSNFDVLESKIKVDLPGYKHSQTNGHSLYLAQGADLADDAIVDGNLILGKGASIGGGVKISGNVIVGDGAMVEAGSELKDVVVWKDAVVNAGRKIDSAVVLESEVVNVYEHPKSSKSALLHSKTQAPVGARV